MRLAGRAVEIIRNLGSAVSRRASDPDEFEGRETGEKGQKMAVEYLKSQYQALNIPTPLGNDDYFQEVPLEKQSVSEAKITVNGKDFKSFEEHIVLRASGNVNSISKVAFIVPPLSVTTIFVILAI